MAKLERTRLFPHHRNPDFDIHQALDDMGCEVFEVRLNTSYDSREYHVLDATGTLLHKRAWYGVALAYAYLELTGEPWQP